jgi:hypothetical protein
MKRRTFLQNSSALEPATLVTSFGILHHHKGSFQADTPEAGFKTPPQSARQHTWWHWMNGNMTKEGITTGRKASKKHSPVKTATT